MRRNRSCHANSIASIDSSAIPASMTVLRCAKMRRRLRPVEGGIAFPGVREVVGMECEGATSAEWPFMSFDFPGGIGHPGLRSLYDSWENLRAGPIGRASWRERVCQDW